MYSATHWFLVMNATRARLLRGLSEEGTPATAELVLRAPGYHLRDIMSDKPGRSFSSGSAGRRSAMAYGSDPLREDEIAFIRQVFNLIEAHRRAGEVQRLTVIAAPGTLGLLRSEMPPALRRLVHRELDKNLAGIPEAQLPGVVRHELSLQ